MSRKSITTALVLAFFFGAFGVHRFYVGKTGTGIVMFLLSLSFVGSIVTVPWAWIDIIHIIVGNFKDKENRIVDIW